jgi:hypothetical protein
MFLYRKGIGVIILWEYYMLINIFAKLFVVKCGYEKIFTLICKID